MGGGRVRCSAGAEEGAEGAEGVRRVYSVRGGCESCAEGSIEGDGDGQGRASGVRGTAVCTCETLFERSSGMLSICMGTRCAGQVAARSEACRGAAF